MHETVQESMFETAEVAAEAAASGEPSVSDPITRAAVRQSPRESSTTPPKESARASNKKLDQDGLMLPSNGPALALSITDFAALEQRVLRAVDLVRRERQARSEADEQVEFHKGRAEALEARVESLEEELRSQQSQVTNLEQLEHEISSLRQEREQVRQRVERLLNQLDALEL